MNSDTKSESEKCKSDDNHLDISEKLCSQETAQEGIQKVQAKVQKHKTELSARNIPENSKPQGSKESVKCKESSLDEKGVHSTSEDKGHVSDNTVESTNEDTSSSCGNNEADCSKSPAVQEAEVKAEKKLISKNSDSERLDQEQDITSSDFSQSNNPSVPERKESSSSVTEETSENDKLEIESNLISSKSKPDSSVAGSSPCVKVQNNSNSNEEPMDVDIPSSSTTDISEQEQISNGKSVKENVSSPKCGKTDSIGERILGMSPKCETPEMIVSDVGPVTKSATEKDKPVASSSKGKNSEKDNHVTSDDTSSKTALKIKRDDGKSESSAKHSDAQATPKSEHKKGDGERSKRKKNKTCEECGATKGLKFQVLFQGKTRFLCSDTCFKNFKIKQKQTKSAPEPSSTSNSVQESADACVQCKKEINAGQGYYPLVGEMKPLCSDECTKKYQEVNGPAKKCSQCKKVIEDSYNCLTWETMEFCNEDCLGKYQSFLGSHCTCCQSPVQQSSLGKYCVCFGADIRQFCSGSCLEEFKKGLKVCSFCQKDLSSGVDGFLAPVGEKGQFKDFCTQQCMERYEIMNTNSNAIPQVQECSHCKKQGTFKIQVKHEEKPHVLCCDRCVAGFRYTNKIKSNMCETCYKFFDPESEEQFSLQLDAVHKHFCTKACMTLFVLSHRKIVPCIWCKVKKYNFDMIEKSDLSNQSQVFCSLNCLSLYRVSLSATSSKSIRCDNCTKNLPAQYHLTMSDGSIRNFCTYQCVLLFQNQFTNVPALTTAATSRQNAAQLPGSKTAAAATGTPVISNVVSLAAPSRAAAPSLVKKLVPQKLVSVRQQGPSLAVIATKPQTVSSTITSSSPSSVISAPSGSQMLREVIVKPPAPKSVKNKTVSCKPIMQTKGVSCKPHPCHKAVQTDDRPRPIILPIPVPIYVPTPLHLFSRPVPCPVPFPMPIPVPIIVPTTKDSPSQIIKHLKDIQEKIPTNPFEAELLMMAEMVAEDGSKNQKGQSKTDSTIAKKGDESVVKKLVKSPESADMEKQLPLGVLANDQKEQEAISDLEDEYFFKDSRSHLRGKRSISLHGKGKDRKRSKTDELSAEDADLLPTVPMDDDQNTACQPDHPETYTRLKHTFGVNAWKHWVLQKNTQLEKGSQSSRKFKLFKTDLLQLPPDELNYSLCLFVKEVRKPNGEEYGSGSIYYLSLGIQQYLFENGRIDNIFTDPYYEKFTECLNDVLQSQEELMTIEGFSASRIEEEILWESKQLGAHSPHVLLNTLMYFNTKYFKLKTVEDHTRLSFTHITKHWRKNNVKGGTRNVLLRYYPPLIKDFPRRHKEDTGVYEQVENVVNPLRCPVKLYEFYISKCPESVKIRNDLFYLYPERSCVPDSPVWYSTQALGQDAISKMIQRIKIVREINDV